MAIVSSSEAVEAEKPHSWYSMGSPKPKVRLEDGSKIMALLETGAEINVMTREVMEEFGLAMRHRPKLELVSHAGNSRPFLGLFECGGSNKRSQNLASHFCGRDWGP